MLIADDQIAAVLAPGSAPAAPEIVDAQGAIIAPGLQLGPDGAIASTYAHDSHNLLVLGTLPSAMAAAANAVIDAGGGIAVAHGEHIRALLPLAIGGIMSAEPAQTIVDRSAAVRQAMEEWGYRHANPFMSMACLSLPVSPQLKLTDQGPVDVDRRAWAEPILSRPEGWD